MPNWCCNYLKVTGPKKDLDAFKATLNSPDPDQKGAVVPFSFAQTVPPPANMSRDSLSMEETAKLKEQGIPHWYDWQSENWGCKWDACEVSVEVQPKSVEVHFDTPWGPPQAWMRKASAAHPKLKFVLHCCEGGMGYYGTLTAKAGVVDEDISDFPKDTYDDDGNVTGEVEKFVEKYGIGVGG
jgi:hypothetical protein